MGYDVRVETVAENRPLAIVRRRASLGELPKVVPEACGVVWKVVRARGIAGAGRHVAVYLDDEINLEVGVEVEGPVAGDGEVVGSELPAGTVATTTHFGPYGRLGEAHQAVRDWCGKNGYALAGVNWEVYGHWVAEWERDPSGIRTEVFYLLAR